MAIDSPLMSLFGRSPVKPMLEHISKAQACAQELLPFFDALFKNDWDEVVVVRQRIAVLEGEADTLKRDIRLHLPKSLFMPVPRSDLLELLTMQDRIANCAKDISGVILGRKMAFPESMKDLINEYLASSLAATGQANKALNELDELFETGFGGQEIKLVTEMLVKLDELEHKADECEIQIRQQLMSLEKELNPIDVMFMYKVFDLIGDLANIAQRVGSRLQIVIAR